MPFILGPSLLPEPNVTDILLNKTLEENHFDYDYESYMRYLIYY